MKSGRVTYFNDEKGFGFIQDDENSEDFFIHCSNIDGDRNILRVNDRVQFNVKPGPKGMQAIEAILAE